MTELQKEPDEYDGMSSPPLVCHLSKCLCYSTLLNLSWNSASSSRAVGANQPFLTIQYSNHKHKQLYYYYYTSNYYMSKLGLIY